jgi:hypothetical protein
MTEAWKFCDDPHCAHPTPHYYTRPQDGPPPSGPNFEVMWHDAVRHRAEAEARARRYQDRLQAIAAITCPDEESL